MYTTFPKEYYPMPANPLLGFEKEKPIIPIIHDYEKKGIGLIGGLPPEIQKKIFNGNIARVMSMMETSRHWYAITNEAFLWGDLGENSAIPQPLNKEIVKKYVVKTKGPILNWVDNLQAPLKNELAILLKCERIVDIDLLVRVSKARDTLVIWAVLQEIVGGNLNLAIENVVSTDMLIEMTKEFSNWLKEHQASLEDVSKLDLANNQLTSLPNEFGQLTNLAHLFLEGNKLTTLPNEFGQLTDLVTLNLSKNQLTSLPNKFGQLRSLVTLNLAHNQLTSLPNEFGQLTRLVNLDISNNPLASLPSGFGQLKGLCYINLSNSKLTSLPMDIVYLRIAETAIREMLKNYLKFLNHPDDNFETRF